jgi:hypothetical protein
VAETPPIDAPVEPAPTGAPADAINDEPVASDS